MRIDKAYLMLPVTDRMTNKKLKFIENGELIFDLDVRLDPVSPRAVACYDVRRFIGRDITFEVEPPVPFTPVLTDRREEPELYREKYRPQVHFSTRFGWLNDPNGLIKIGDTYHLYYQHNPCMWNWGNMHWGHAISTDLFHWQEQEIVLFPDELGTMFSGSAIEDTRNVSGLGDGVTPPILYFYTAAPNSLLSRGHSCSQCLAYSTDGGMTLQKYAANPIVPHIMAENRDPKVVWCEPLGKYLMALYLDGNLFTLLSSADLLHWERFQDLEMPGERECPDMFPLTADDGQTHWCICGASTYYLVGDFIDGRFVPIQDIRQLRRSGLGYAGQTYSGLPDGRRLLFLWENLPLGSDTLCGQMSVPLELRLKKDAGGYRLTAYPAKEIETLAAHTEERHGVCVRRDAPLRLEGLGREAGDLLLTFPYQEGKTFTVSLFGESCAVDMAKNEVCLNNCRVPLDTDRTGMCDVRMIFDTCTTEIFTEDGAYPMPVSAVADRNLDTLTVTGEVDDLSVSYTALNGIWD